MCESYFEVGLKKAYPVSNTTQPLLGTKTIIKFITTTSRNTNWEEYKIEQKDEKASQAWLLYSIDYNSDLLLLLLYRNRVIYIYKGFRLPNISQR